MSDVLAVRRRTVGDDHPSTLDSMTNLALQVRPGHSYPFTVFHCLSPRFCCLQLSEMGRFADALPLCQEAVAAMRRTLGGEHEHTLVAIHSLAALHNRCNPSSPLGPQPCFARAQRPHSSL